MNSELHAIQLREASEELEAENARLRDQIIEQARKIDAYEKKLEEIANLARKLWEITP